MAGDYIDCISGHTVKKESRSSKSLYILIKLVDNGALGKVIENDIPFSVTLSYYVELLDLSPIARIPRAACIF